jgi:hypothetical protein
MKTQEFDLENFFTREENTEFKFFGSKGRWLGIACSTLALLIALL